MSSGDTSFEKTGHGDDLLYKELFKKTQRKTK